MLTILRQPQVTNVTRRLLYTTPNRNGYIVLVPEIGEEGHLTDGVIKPDGLPAFNDITIEVCLGAIGQQAGAVEKTVKSLEEGLRKGENLDQKKLYRELDEVTGPLDTTWGIAKALYLGNSTLIPTKSYMNIHERARNARATKYCNKTIYKALQGASDQQTGAEEQRLRQKFLLEGKLNGLTLNKDTQEGLKELLSQLGKERANFKNKVNMAVHTFAHVVNDYQLVRDFPDTLLEATARNPQQPMQGPWKITLQPQIVEGFLKYCPDRLNRWNVWRANVMKASPQLEKSLENSTHLEKIRALRRRQANILGYPTYAEMSMQTKMVQGVENLKQLFGKLLKFAGPAQSVEIADLQQFATESGFGDKLDLYDISYWRRKYLNAEHQLNEEKLREYFPLPRVFSGLFAFSEKLFNIKITERPNTDVWNAAVKYYDVYDCDASNGAATPIGGFYVDCYSKEHKFGKNNGWMIGIRNRNKSAELTPLCALIFNFSEPAMGKPYLLTYDDLQMVFKTFGSALQHLLTQAAYTDLAGLSNIEWDASQISGYVMSNFLDNPTILQTISGHCETDEQIDATLAEKTRLLKTQLAGYNLCQELYYADLDIELHSSQAFWLDVVRKTWPIYRCLPLDKKDSHPCSMTDIFSGDWGAAQFSHLYSKIIAADITNAFEQHGKDTDLTSVGKRYKQSFLAYGGSLPTAEVFRRFNGRDPSAEALLKSLNIFNGTQTTGEL